MEELPTDPEQLLHMIARKRDEMEATNSGRLNGHFSDDVKGRVMADLILDDLILRLQYRKITGNAIDDDTLAKQFPIGMANVASRSRAQARSSPSPASSLQDGRASYAEQQERVTEQFQSMWKQILVMHKAIWLRGKILDGKDYDDLSIARSALADATDRIISKTAKAWGLSASEAISRTTFNTDLFDNNPNGSGANPSKVDARFQLLVSPKELEEFEKEITELREELLVLQRIETAKDYDPTNASAGVDLLLGVVQGDPRAVGVAGAGIVGGKIAEKVVRRLSSRLKTVRDQTKLDPHNNKPSLQPELFQREQALKQASTAITKSNSPIWKELEPFRGNLKTNGLNGKNRQYYNWDHTHNDIEVYDHLGDHIGTIDAVSGKMVKPAVEGRTCGIN